MDKEIYKNVNEFDYTPPEGGWECLANISYIVDHLLTKYPNTNLELNIKEFTGFMSVFNNEVMVSILLDKRLIEKKGLGINKILREGFEFRGIKIRVK